MTAHDLSRVSWRKSSYSEDNEGECVEIAQTPRVVAVRDSKHPEGPVLAFTRAEWRGLLSDLKNT